jgi:uridine kinase
MEMEGLLLFAVSVWLSHSRRAGPVSISLADVRPDHNTETYISKVRSLSEASVTEVAARIFAGEHLAYGHDRAGAELQKGDDLMAIQSDEINVKPITVHSNMSSPSVIVIGIAGGSGSGKTTLADAIYKEVGVGNITYISHDSYYRDQSHLSAAERETLNFDHPDILDTDLLVEHIRQLKGGKSVRIPRYNFGSHTRDKETEPREPRKIILVEGILIFSCMELVKLMDVKIFVDTPDDIRLIRRMRRDATERGREVASIITQYLTTVRPMHLEFVEPSKKNADVIVPVGVNSVALDLIVSKLMKDLLG